MFRSQHLYAFALCLSALLAGSRVQALEVLIDNDDTSCSVVGNWTRVTSNVYGADKLRHDRGTGSDSVTWSANLSPGWYRVDFRMNSNTGYSTAAHYTITHRDGTETRIVSQKKGSSGWYVLGGAYYFDTTATVTLTDDFPEGTGTYVVADAVRFLSVFSFVQMSDSHVGYAMGTADAQLVAQELKSLGKTPMAGYGFDAPPPSFALHSGDATEYGAEYWSTAQSIFSGLPFPVYYVLGNHDSTWNSTREKLRALYGSPYYSFDWQDHDTRYHFVGLDSTVLQTPRGSFSREELDWLDNDLANVDSTTPVFLNFHHPIDNDSDPKPYDVYRLYEKLRSHNPVIAFCGHGHSFVDSPIDGMTQLEGGSTYDAAAGKRGYNLITVTDGRIHVAKKIYGEPDAATGMINNMRVPAAPVYPVISVTSPQPESVQTQARLALSVSIGLDTVTTASYDLDGANDWHRMTGSAGGPYTATPSATNLVHGRHWVRYRFSMDNGDVWYKMVPFWFWDGDPQPKWMADLGASSLGAPTVADGKVYVGTNGGSMRCFDAQTGTLLWRVDLPSDVVSSPAVSEGRVVFGCGNAKVYCLDAQTGSQLWAKNASGPVYSSPAMAESKVFIGSNGTGAANSANLYCFDLLSGTLQWKYAVGCSIETRPCVDSGVVYFGAWDSYFYALNTSDGSLKWRFQRNANRYYSPADSWPVVSPASGQVFVADREYYLSAINTATGALDWSRTGVSALGFTPDNSTLLQRVMGSAFQGTTFGNAPVWSASCSLDSAPVAPMCAGQFAAVCDQDGLANIIGTSTGNTRYQFQVTQGYQLNPVNTDENANLYAATYDGYLLCVSGGPQAKVEGWQKY